MNSALRLSRIAYPRATLWSTALLIAVFAAFGLWVEALKLV